ncbi:MAG TPA: GNAT family N-acetyltransferase [Cyanobacteria bacterium UBA11372]|nr:GNAT family N-acetyltransferase [Cyanobacteria bacterium UBA11372]
MNYSIRLETESDYRETEMITRESFWDVYKPGCDEHLILHKIRKVKAFVKELDLVVCDRERIVGNIIYSKAIIINENNDCFEVLCMGPVCVLPDYQKKGIGSLLINESIKMARKLKYKGIILLGNPNFYGKFGFKKASLFNIQTSAGKDFDYLLALELYEGSLNGISGRFYEDSVFQVAPNELVEFEKQFPFKEKHITDTQLK